MLKTTKVEEFWDSEVRAVIEISSKLTVAEGFQRLLDNNVLSAPVFDEDDNHKYVGFLDLRDIVSWAVFLFDEDVDPAVDLLDVINAGQRYFKQQGLGKITVKCKKKMHSHKQQQQRN